MKPPVRPNIENVPRSSGECCAHTANPTAPLPPQLAAPSARLPKPLVISQELAGPRWPLPLTLAFSAVFGRLQDFLPRLQAANEVLEQQLASGAAAPADLDIENVGEEGEDKPVIEMVGAEEPWRGREARGHGGRGRGGSEGGKAGQGPPFSPLPRRLPHHAANVSALHASLTACAPFPTPQDLACGLFDLKDEKSLAAAQRAIAAGPLHEAEVVADGSDCSSDSSGSSGSSSDGTGGEGGGEEAAGGIGSSGDLEMEEAPAGGRGSRGPARSGSRAGGPPGGVTEQQAPRRQAKKKRRPLIQEVAPS
jgi:hypothetical protein